MSTMMRRLSAVTAWCVAVCAVAASLAATFAYGRGHTIGHQSLFFVAILAGVPALTFLLLTGLHDAAVWMLRTRPRRPVPSLVFPGRVVLAGLVGCSLLAGSFFLIDHLSGSAEHANANPPPRPSAAPPKPTPVQSSSKPARQQSSSPARLVAFLQEPGAGLERNVTAMEFSPNGKILATTGGESIYLWDVASRTLTATLTDPDNGGVSALSFSPDGMTLAAADENGNTYLWNIDNRSVAVTLPYPGPDLNFGMIDVTFSPDGRSLATVDGDGNTYLWDTATRTVTARLTGPYPSPITANVAAFSPDGSTLATSDDEGDTYLWDLATRTRTATFHDPRHNAVADVAFSPDGRFLATGDVLGTTYLWSLNTGSFAGSLAGNPSVYTDVPVLDAIAFSPDGKALVAGNQGGSDLYLWDRSTGKHIATFYDAGSNYTYAVAFSPDGKILAACDSLGHINLWMLN
jgi:Tol biopolymer transport system component